MNRNVHGFTVLEWMIYFFLVLVVVTGVFQFAAGVRRHVVAVSEQVGCISHASAALDALVRDLALAPQKLDEWQEQGPEKIAWKYGNTLIAWEVEEGNVLVRKEKTMDQATHMWKPTKKSVVARDVDSFRAVPLFALHGPQKERLMVGVELALRYKGVGRWQAAQTTVALCNRRLA